MNLPFKTALPTLFVLAYLATLSACGGGAGVSAAAVAPAPTAPEAIAPVSLAGVFSAVGPPTTTTPIKTPPTPIIAGPTKVITDAGLESTSTVAQTMVPLTFGQVFAKGEVPTNVELTGTLADGSVVPLQVDSKATHSDGSLRHAVLSTVVPKLAAGQSLLMTIKQTSTVRSAETTTPAVLLGAGFTASVNLKVGTQTYSVSATDLLKSGKYTTWLSGATVNEWHVSAPLKTAAGVEHPHLSARFAIRSYNGLSKARVDVTIENSWAYEPNPSAFTYDATITVGGQTTFQKTGMTHYHHARWRKLAWWGAAPEVNIKHNISYLIASRALPNYDQSIKFSESTLAQLKANYAVTNTEPMGLGFSMAYMPTTGGRPDIGLLPGWAATYLLTMDKRAKDATLGTAELAGSFSMHYRDKKTDRPISLLDYPYMTIIDPHVGDTYNPATGKTEAFPALVDGDSPYTFDVSHQPAYAYLPYLVTGDYYYLEELQFWAMANVFNGHPGYRETSKGLLLAEQTRGQAWSMRTLGEVAYITPDADKLKSAFTSILTNNLDWYNKTYVETSATSNALGAITNGYAYSYIGETGIAPWQDDFFTAALGHVLELGFDKAKPILQWKAAFPVMRLSAQGACWIDGASYQMQIRPTVDSPVFQTMAQVYSANHSADFSALLCNSAPMAAALGLRVSEMTNYADSVLGNPAIMQSALAYAVDVGVPSGKVAWTVFSGRSFKPDYSQSPQFAIIPR